MRPCSSIVLLACGAGLAAACKDPPPRIVVEQPAMQTAPTEGNAVPASGSGGGNRPGGGGQSSGGASRPQKPGASAETDDPGPPAELATFEVLKASLNGYLFQPGDFDKLSALVLKYPTPDFEPFPETKLSKKYGEYGSFFQEQLNQSMKVKRLAPGRTFEVRIIEDESLNASADVFQVVRINTGYMVHGTVDSFVSTLCHEMAHSTRNHPSIPQPDVVLDFYKKTDEYYVKTFNFELNTYRHDRTAYLALREEWDGDVAKAASNHSKRSESEADIVGAMICAVLGMPPSTYIKGYREEKARNGTGIVPGEEGKTNGMGLLGLGLADIAVEDGKELTGGFETTLEFGDLDRFLFPLDSHPGEDERIEQLERVVAKIDPYFDQSGKFYAALKGRLRDGNPTGIGLTDFLPRARPRRIVRSSGISLSLPPHDSCAHARPRPAKK